MSDMKAHIDNQLSDITISNELTNTILSQTANRKEIKNYQFTPRRWIALASAICLLLTCSMTAFAATVPAFNDWIYTVNPKLAEMLYPINKSAEDNGIKVTVLSALNDSHNAVVYFTVQDTTGENRVNEKVDLCDTCDIDGPCGFNVSMISYDEKTNTALFVMRGSGGEGMSNRMTTFDIGMLMNNKITHDWYNTNVDIASVLKNKVKSFPISKFKYNGGSAETAEGLSVLEPDVMKIPLGDGIDFVTISNIGFLDGKLHIQTKWETSFDNHGDFWLADEKGVVNDTANKIRYNAYSFRTRDDSEKCGKNRFAKHFEYVFDVSSINELSGYNLWASFVEDGNFTLGEWKVNFRLSHSDNIFTGKISGIAKSVEVTSIGAYVNGYYGNPENCDLSIVMKDGTTLGFSQHSENDSQFVNNNKWDISMMFNMPIDKKDILRIAIDGIEIYKAQ